MHKSDKLLFDKALEEHGTQQALADHLGVDKSLISYWKKNGIGRSWRKYFEQRYNDPSSVDSTRIRKSKK